MRRDDGNSGNFVWQYAATRLLNPATHVIQPLLFLQHMSQQQDVQLNTVDTLVVSTANVLMLEKDGIFAHVLTWYQHVAATLRVPTVVIGMGVQADFGALSPTDVQTRQLYPHQKAFLQELHQWQAAPATGVRGNATATICRNSGETHCWPVGCPTLFFSRALNLGKTLAQKWRAVQAKVQRGEKLNLVLTMPAFNPHVADPLQAKHRDVMGKYLSRLDKTSKSSFWIKQMSFDDANLHVWEQQYNFTADWRQYDNVDAWKHDIIAHNTDLVISTRIHGGMMGLASETPTIVIATDFRILELVEAMKIPHLTMDDVHDKGALKKVANVLKFARFQDFDAFEQNRRLRLQQWKDILATGNLELDPTMQRILDAPL
uniref:Polysaccharide pyruvyl transferase domain-containing protein n=1 Tax=Entomoneis paludosa TaxID=265537 RepID=A0A7S2YLZ2_9STRA